MIWTDYYHHYYTYRCGVTPDLYCLLTWLFPPQVGRPVCGRWRSLSCMRNINSSRLSSKISSLSSATRCSPDIRKSVHFSFTTTFYILIFSPWYLLANRIINYCSTDIFLKRWNFLKCTLLDFQKGIIFRISQCISR